MKHVNFYPPHCTVKTHEVSSHLKIFTLTSNAMKSTIDTQIAFLCVIDILQSITRAQSLSHETNGNLTKSTIRKTFDNNPCGKGKTFSDIGFCLAEGYRVIDPPTSTVTKVYVDFWSQDIIGVKEDENLIDLGKVLD